MGFFVGLIFLGPGMRGVVGGDNIQPVIQQGRPQSLPVMRGFDGRIAFDPVAQPGIIITGEVQVMHTDLRGDPFILQGKHIGKKLQLLFGTDMQDM